MKARPCKRSDRISPRESARIPRCLSVLATGLALIGIARLGAAQGAIPMRETLSMPQVRQMHGAAVLGDYLYVIGGVLNQDPQPFTLSVIKAHIKPNHDLEGWEETTPLPTSRAYIDCSTVVQNDILYVVGGWDHTAKIGINTVLVARPLSDGYLSPWMETPPFPGVGNHCLTAVATPGYLHIMGGLGEKDEVSNAVISGQIGPNGMISEWRLSPPLPTPLWYHNAAAIRGRLWIWGGLTTREYQVVSPRVFSAPILSTGGLGEWQEETPSLPVAFYGATSASAGAYILSFCPRLAGAAQTNDIWYSAITPKGLAPWQKMPSALTVTRYMAAAPDYRRGSIYIVGGRIEKTAYEKRVFYFLLSESAQEAVQGAPEAQASKVTGETSRVTADTWSGPQGGSSQYTYQAMSQVPAGAIPGFLTLEGARAAAMTPPAKPILLYFHHDMAKPCQNQVEMLKSPSFAPLLQQAAFAWMNVRDYPQIVQQLGVYRAPTWILYDRQFRECGRVSGAISPEQLAAGIASVK